jgi:glycosyltransferase involved in cell wall biosynthesis
MKNVLLTIENLSGGGAELVVANLCRGLDRGLFNVKVCCLNDLGERGEQLRAEGFDVGVLPGGKHRHDKYLKWLELRRFMKQHATDLVHSHSPGSLFDSVVAARSFRRARHIHTFHFGNYPYTSGKRLVLEKVFARGADGLVAVGIEQRRMISTVFGLAPERLEVVWNGIRIPQLPELSPAAADSPEDGRKLVLGSLSTLSEQKGLTYLLDAIEILSRNRRDFELRIVGEGPLRPFLAAKATSLGLEDLVRFYGWIPNAAGVVLPSIDIFIQSSLWEAMSMVVLEAMASGKPVVATDVGDNRHIIESGVNGVVVPTKSPERMAEALNKLMNDGEVRRSLGEKARASVSENCSVSSMVSQYQRIYLEVLGSRTFESAH